MIRVGAAAPHFRLSVQWERPISIAVRQSLYLINGLSQASWLSIISSFLSRRGDAKILTDDCKASWHRNKCTVSELGELCHTAALSSNFQ